MIITTEVGERQPGEYLPASHLGDTHLHTSRTGFCKEIAHLPITIIIINNRVTSSSWLHQSAVPSARAPASHTRMDPALGRLRPQQEQRQEDSELLWLGDMSRGGPWWLLSPG